MNPQRDRSEPSSPTPKLVLAYARRSSKLQAENFSLDAQKRAIREACKLRGLPEPIFFEDDERSARGEQIANRPDFKRLLECVQANPGRAIVFVHTLDRWSRNVMVTLQSFRILSQARVAFVSLSENIDYSTPEGMLQLTILAAFAAYFSDMLAKHTSKGKGERAAQGLYNGDIPFGYRRVGPKLPSEHDPQTFPGLRLIGELRMVGTSAEKIADAVNAAGYRTGSKRFGNRLFTIDTINAICRNEFYAAFASGDDRGTITYRGERYRGQHPAAFTHEEWQKIRAGSRMNYNAPQRTEQAHRVYEFAGYIADIYCGLTLRCQGGGDSRYRYYKDVAKKRQLPCPAGGFLQVRVDMARLQFGELLEDFTLPEHWRDEVRRKLVEAVQSAGQDAQSIERERERLKLKRSRTLKQHREGYLTDEEFHGEMAAVELALRELDVPQMDGLRLDDIIAAGERLPGIAALWEAATPEERREMVLLMLEPGGLYYDLELKEIAALRPRPAFLPVMRLMEGFIEYEEATGTLVTGRWRRRNRRASASLSPIFYLFLAPTGIMYQRVQRLRAEDERTEASHPQVLTHRRSGPQHPTYGIPTSEWSTVVQRVVEQKEPLRTLAAAYGVSHETIRRIILYVQKQQGQQEA